MNRTYEDYRLKGRSFPAKFDGYCAIESHHRIKRKDNVSYVELRENPLILIPGVACQSCVSVMTH